MQTHIIGESDIKVETQYDDLVLNEIELNRTIFELYGSHKFVRNYLDYGEYGCNTYYYPGLVDHMRMIHYAFDYHVNSVMYALKKSSWARLFLSTEYIVLKHTITKDELVFVGRIHKNKFVMKYISNYNEAKLKDMLRNRTIII